jgi:L-ascorbate metabolism protein UlaG (beta-lactamase superfamily)
MRMSSVAYGEKWELTWHGHATWSIESSKGKILIDPFLDGNPAAKFKAADMDPTHILISHGHEDHIADAASIARRTGAHLFANFEVAQWLGKHHQIKNAVGMNHGGRCKTEFGHATLVPAIHSSSLPDGSYGGTAGGWLIELDIPGSAPYRIYYAGDTSFFGDMKWIARKGVDCFIVPIGDLFTMGPEDSLEAIAIVAPKIVLPTHYNTWPPIHQNAQAWANAVRATTSAEPIVAEVGKSMAIG